MANWADLLAIPDLDIIWIGTPPYMHSAVTVSALEAGKHVFCQARMSMDRRKPRKCSRLRSDIRSWSRCFVRRRSGCAAILLVKKLLAENYLGRPHHVRLQSFNGNFLDPDAPAHWRQRIEISGLNVLTLGIYVEVLQRWLGEITGVFARGKILQPLRQGYEVIIPDVLTVLCNFANGAEGVLEFSGVDPHGSGDRLEIYGNRGTMTYDFGSDLLRADRWAMSVAHDRNSIGSGGRLAGRRRFHRRREIERSHATASRFRGWRSLHASCPGRGRFARAQRVGRD